MRGRKVHEAVRMIGRSIPTVRGCWKNCIGASEWPRGIPLGGMAFIGRETIMANSA